MQDLNLRPLGPKPSALPSCANRRIYFENLKWSAMQDLNLRPLGPKPSALPSCANRRTYILSL